MFGAEVVGELRQSQLARLHTPPMHGAAAVPRNQGQHKYSRVLAEHVPHDKQDRGQQHGHQHRDHIGAKESKESKESKEEDEEEDPSTPLQIYTARAPQLGSSAGDPIDTLRLLLKQLDVLAETSATTNEGNNGGNVGTSDDGEGGPKTPPELRPFQDIIMSGKG